MTTLPVPLPMPVVVTRHQCSHCRRYTRASLTRVQQHMAVCWKNPAARGCKTCRHFEPPEPGPYDEHPGWPEGCGADGGPELERPIVHCPLWEPDAHHTTPAPAAG
ncbi:hypothetical protein ACWEIM_29920 [Streptomyces sp. NPDC004778]